MKKGAVRVLGRDFWNGGKFIYWVGYRKTFSVKKEKDHLQSKCFTWGNTQDVKVWSLTVFHRLVWYLMVVYYKWSLRKRLNSQVSSVVVTVGGQLWLDCILCLTQLCKFSPIQNFDSLLRKKKKRGGGGGGGWGEEKIHAVVSSW